MLISKSKPALAEKEKGIKKVAPVIKQGATRKKLDLLVKPKSIVKAKPKDGSEEEEQDEKEEEEEEEEKEGNDEDAGNNEVKVS